MLSSFLPKITVVIQIYNERRIFLSTVKNTESKLLDYTHLRLTQILFFGDTWLYVHNNSSILNGTIVFVLFCMRFEQELF